MIISYVVNAVFLKFGDVIKFLIPARSSRLRSLPLLPLPVPPRPPPVRKSNLKITFRLQIPSRDVGCLLLREESHSYLIGVWAEMAVMSPVIMTSVIRRALWWPDAWTRSPPPCQDWYCLWQLCQIFPKSFSLISRHEALKIWADFKARVPPSASTYCFGRWRKEKEVWCLLYIYLKKKKICCDGRNLLDWLCSLASDMKCDI